MKYNYQYLEEQWKMGYWKFIEHTSSNLLNWYSISVNSNITWDIILSNLDKPWNWKGISRNPNITW